MRKPVAAHDPIPKMRPSFPLIVGFAVEIALNNTKLSRNGTVRQDLQDEQDFVTKSYPVDPVHPV